MNNTTEVEQLRQQLEKKTNEYERLRYAARAVLDALEYDGIRKMGAVYDASETLWIELGIPQKDR